VRCVQRVSRRLVRVSGNDRAPWCSAIATNASVTLARWRWADLEIYDCQVSRAANTTVTPLVLSTRERPICLPCFAARLTAQITTARYHIHSDRQCVLEHDHQHQNGQQQQQQEAWCESATRAGLSALIQQSSRRRLLQRLISGERRPMRLAGILGISWRVSRDVPRDLTWRRDQAWRRSAGDSPASRWTDWDAVSASVVSRCLVYSVSQVRRRRCRPSCVASLMDS